MEGYIRIIQGTERVSAVQVEAIEHNAIAQINPKTGQRIICDKLLPYFEPIRSCFRNEPEAA